MKKIVFGGISLLIFSTFISSCKKEVSDVDLSRKNVSEHECKIQFYNENGQSISKSNVNMQDENTILIVESTENEISARYFTNQDVAHDYVSSKPSLVDAKLKMEFAREVRELAIQTGDIAKTDPKDFSSEMKEKLASYSSNQDKGVGILYDNLNATGPTFPVTGNPQFTLFGFNNRAESAAGVGIANWLWDRTWYRGASVYLLLGTGVYINFDGINFQNRAESSL